MLEVCRLASCVEWLLWRLRSIQMWITPTLFDGPNNPAVVDEWTFCQYVSGHPFPFHWLCNQDYRYQDYDTAHSKLVDHWNTWITENDFRSIKAAGLNHVRLPIGYWAFDISQGHWEAM